MFSFSVCFLLLLLLLHCRQKPKSVSWWIQIAILGCLLGAILFPRSIPKPLTRMVLIDMSLSFQPRVYQDLKQPFHRIYKEVKAFVQKNSTPVGLMLFAKDYKLLFPPISASSFLQQLPFSLENFSSWQEEIDPSETNLVSAERFLVEKYGPLEILLFSDGHFQISEPSSSVAYSPVLLPEMPPETQILSFSGPVQIRLLQSIPFTIRLQGERGETRALLLFQNEQLLYRKMIEFTDSNQILSQQLLCPPGTVVGAQKYRAILSPSTSEFFPQNNSKEWTVFIEEAPSILLLSSTLEKESWFVKTSYSMTYKQVGEISQLEDLLPFQVILYCPEASMLSSNTQELFCSYIQQGGIFLLFGNPWISFFAGSRLEQVLPILCGAEPEPLEIHFFLDCSGSMNQLLAGESQTRLQSCLQALYRVHLLLEQLPLSISSRIQYRFWAGRAGEAISVPVEQINTLIARGNTALGSSLNQFLAQVPPSSEKKKHLLLLFSDGETQDRDVFLSLSKRLEAQPFQVFCFQLPQTKNEPPNTMLSSFVAQSSLHRLISVAEYSQLGALLMQELERETQLFYRSGNFRATANLPEVSGYARSRLQIQGIEKITIEKEPFFAVRAVDLGASGFFAIDPQKEQWTPSEAWDAFFFQEVLPLLEQYQAPDIYWQWKGQTFECNALSTGPYFLRQKSKQWELEPQGFGKYAKTFSSEMGQKEFQLLQKDRVIASISGEEETEWSEMFLQTDVLFRLSSQPARLSHSFILAYRWILMAIFGVFCGMLWKKRNE